MKMQMAEIAKALNTTCEGDDQTVITSVAFDSRKITMVVCLYHLKVNVTDMIS